MLAAKVIHIVLGAVALLICTVAMVLYVRGSHVRVR